MAEPISFIGIDPGQKGGVAMVNQFGQAVGGFTLPHHEDDPKVIVWPMILKFFLNKCRGAYVSIEQMPFMGKRGQIATMSLAENIGVFKGLLVAAALPFESVHPSTWQSVLINHHQGKSKERALKTFEEKWPEMASQLRMSHDKVPDGIADAMLIAEYGRLQYFARD